MYKIYVIVSILFVYRTNVCPLMIDFSSLDYTYSNMYPKNCIFKKDTFNVNYFVGI